MEKAVRWSPSSTLSEQRFLVADVKDRLFKLFKVDEYDGRTLSFSTTLTYSKVPGFRAFDWAPHDESIVAVGSWSGEVTVLRIDDSIPSVSFPAKRQRLCNAVAFSKTGQLAAGLEGIRNDFCLNIWDVNQHIPTVTSPGGGFTKSFVEPYRRYASSEAISSIKFFAGQPQIFVAGIKGKGIRIYDLRENTGNPSLLFKTESVFNIAIDPLDENYFACAGGPDDRRIQVWDCRSATHFSAAMMGSSSGPGAQEEQPVLEYKDVFKPQKPPTKKHDTTGVMVSTIWSLRYCKGKSGCLGALASTGDFKVFETKHGYSSRNETHRTQEDSGHEVSVVSDPSMLTKRIHRVEYPYDDSQNGRKEDERIVAFDFTNLASSKGTPCAIILRGNQNIEIVELDGAPSALSVSSRGDIVVSRTNESVSRPDEILNEDHFLSNTVRILKPREEGRIAEYLTKLYLRNSGTKNGPLHEDGEGAILEQRPSSRDLHERLCLFRVRNSNLTFQEAMTLSTVTRRRCAEGYLFDCKKNLEVLRDNPWLQKLWNWIERSKVAAENEGMATDTLDLSFFGVAGVWNNDLDSQRSSSKSSKPTYSREVAAAVEELCERLDLPPFQMVDTESPNHRRLCLYTCGLGLRYQPLENLVKDLVRQDQNTKAAALAMIHGQAKLAFLALKNGSPSSIQRELSMALAGFHKGDADEVWEETVSELAHHLEDPYARAIFALVRHGDWHDVLRETALPLRDRVGIALMYLDDHELTQFINTNLVDCVSEGDIEGVVLTGLTEQAVPLFENYIRKFSDLQTAILAMSITCPRYFADSRVDLWRETYRSYLDRWEMWVQRSQFDVQSVKFSTPPDAKPELCPASRQISLRCNYCDQALDRNSTFAPPSTSSTNFGSHSENVFEDDDSGTTCPRCHRHLPRCVICMDWLGMPESHPKGNGAAAMTTATAMNKFISACRSCWHMSHGGHAMQWFTDHQICPVPDCECRCMEIDYRGG